MAWNPWMETRSNARRDLISILLTLQKKSPSRTLLNFLLRRHCSRDLYRRQKKK